MTKQKLLRGISVNSPEGYTTLSVDPRLGPLSGWSIHLLERRGLLLVGYKGKMKKKQIVSISKLVTGSGNTMEEAIRDFERDVREYTNRLKYGDALGSHNHDAGDSCGCSECR